MCNLYTQQLWETADRRGQLTLLSAHHLRLEAHAGLAVGRQQERGTPVLLDGIPQYWGHAVASPRGRLVRHVLPVADSVFSIKRACQLVCPSWRFCGILRELAKMCSDSCQALRDCDGRGGASSAAARKIIHHMAVHARWRRSPGPPLSSAKKGCSWAAEPSRTKVVTVTIRYSNKLPNGGLGRQRPCERRARPWPLRSPPSGKHPLPTPYICRLGALAARLHVSAVLSTHLYHFSPADAGTRPGFATAINITSQPG
jgi:hypothetical protein